MVGHIIWLCVALDQLFDEGIASDAEIIWNFFHTAYFIFLHQFENALESVNDLRLQVLSAKDVWFTVLQI
jgi:hypothetical protein